MEDFIDEDTWLTWASVYVPCKDTKDPAFKAYIESAEMRGFQPYYVCHRLHRSPELFERDKTYMCVCLARQTNIPIKWVYSEGSIDEPPDYLADIPTDDLLNECLGDLPHVEGMRIVKGWADPDWVPSMP